MEKSLVAKIDLNSDSYFVINTAVLDDIVDKFGKRDTKLTDAERSEAVSIVNGWFARTVDDINNKRIFVRHLLSTLDMSASTVDLSNHELVDVAVAVGVDPTDFELAVEARDAVYAERNDIETKYSVVKPTKNNAQLLMYKDVELSDNAVRAYKADVKLKIATTSLISNINKTKQAKRFLSDGRRFITNANRAISDIEASTDRVRINLSVDDADVREALHDLLDVKLV